MNRRNEKMGVVLFNLGGPDSLDAVRPFLYRLFQDPDIFKFPLSSFVRKPLAYLISSLRAKKSRKYFEAIGGSSPLRELTLRQAQALEKALNESIQTVSLGKDSVVASPFKVVVAMRYWYPDTQEAIDELRKEGVERVILLPLYPQYSYATTRSSSKEWERQCQLRGVCWVSQEHIFHYYNHPLYLDAVVERIQEGIRRFQLDNPKDLHLLFSAHGIPLREIKKGDPYDQQIRASVEGIVQRLNHRHPHHISYQSKVGYLKWLEPSTAETLRRLGKEGVRAVLAVPISFVSDHSETLYELKQLYGKLAKEVGIEQYELMPALNDSPLFITALKQIVLGS